MENQNNTQNVEYVDEGISLQDLLMIIKKNLIAIIVFFVAFTAAGFAFGKTRKPKYTASTTMLVSSNLEDVAITTQYSYSKAIADTFISFVKEPIVLKTAAQELNVSYETLKNNVSVKQVDQSLIIKISYTSLSETKAIEYVNKIAENVIKTANSKNESNEDNYPLLVGCINVLSSADSTSVSTSTMKYTLIGAALGIVFVLGYAYIAHVCNKRFSSSEEIERLLGLPVIAGIPEYKFKDELLAKEEK